MGSALDLYRQPAGDTILTSEDGADFQIQNPDHVTEVTQTIQNQDVTGA